MRTDAPQGLTRCFDPGSPDQLNFKTDYQPIVDAAYLAHAFLRAPKALWEPPDSATKERIIAAFKSLRNRKPFNSNWLLFDSMSEAFGYVVLPAIGITGNKRILGGNGRGLDRKKSLGKEKICQGLSCRLLIDINFNIKIQIFRNP